jgi:hypothetical protein
MSIERTAAGLLASIGIAVAVPCQAESDAGVTSETSTESVEPCVSAHQNARLLELEERWLPAREAMTRCAASTCPIAIRSDCAAWLSRLAQTLPTLLVIVERDDDGRQPVHLELDGQSFELSEQPGPIETVPGPHRLRFTLPPHPPVDVALVLEKGEKNRVVRVRFAAPVVRSPVRSPEPSARARSFVAQRPVPGITYWLGGSALASLLASGGLLGSALVSRADARENCAPGCPGEERESIQARLLAADVLAGAAVVLGGLAVYTYVRRPVEVKVWASQPLRLGLSPSASGLQLDGRF